MKIVIEVIQKTSEAFFEKHILYKLEKLITHDRLLSLAQVMRTTIGGSASFSQSSSGFI